MIAIADPAGPKSSAEEHQLRTIAELTQTVSASRLSTWQRCRLQFYFRYVAGIHKAPSPAQHIGGTIHTVLERWNLARWRGIQLSENELKQTFAQAWTIWQEGEQIEWNGEEEKSRSAAWNVLQHYLRNTPITAHEKPEAVEVGVEAELSTHGLPTLVGVIDLVRSGGRIVDFKTSARTPDPKMLAHRSETQTSTYGVLYREATGAKENGIELHHLIKTNKPKLVVNEFGPVSEAQITRLFRVIEAYVNGLQREDFVPSPGLQCGSCEFFQECRAWR